MILVPYLGVFVYLIARGHKMHEHAAEAAQAQDQAARQYIQQVTTTSTADELAKLADLKAQGVIDDAEYAVAQGQGPRRLSPLGPTPCGGRAVPVRPSRHVCSNGRPSSGDRAAPLPRPLRPYASSVSTPA